MNGIRYGLLWVLVGGGEIDNIYMYVHGHGIMSSLHSRNDTSDLKLMLNELKQLSDLDHTEYRFWDFLHWFPTEEDEENAENTPVNERTAEQQKLVDKKRRREYLEQIKEDKARQRQQYENICHAHGITPKP